MISYGPTRTSILIVISATACIAQFQTANPSTIVPAADSSLQTASPTIPAGAFGGYCETETNAFLTCSATSTSTAALDNDACDACLNTKVDYNTIAVSLVSASCDELSTSILNELGKCQTECFPTTNECSDEYLTVTECYFIGVIAPDRCGSPVSSSSDTGTNNVSTPTLSPSVSATNNEVGTTSPINSIETPSPSTIAPTTVSGDAPTISPSFLAGTIGGNCEAETTAFYSCTTTSTSPPVDFDACDDCLEAKVDYSSNHASSSCDELNTFIVNEARKCEAECFPSTNDCSDEYMALLTCSFFDVVAPNKCGAGGNVSSGSDSEGSDSFLGGADRGGDDRSSAHGIWTSLPLVLATMTVVIGAVLQ